MFNADKFIQTQLEHRTEEVEVEDLKEWFDKDDKALWKVRGLSGEEVAKAQETASKSKNLTAIVEALASNAKAEKVSALKELLGTADSVPVELAKRMEMLVHGSVEPATDLALAVKLAKNFPVTFMTLTTKILELTGLGSVDVGKLSASTKSKKSKTS